MEILTRSRRRFSRLRSPATPVEQIRQIVARISDTLCTAGVLSSTTTHCVEKANISSEQNVVLTREGSAIDRLLSASLGIRASWVSSDSRSHSPTGHLRTTVVGMRSSSGPVPALSKGALSQKSQVRIARSTSCPRGHLDKAAERSPCPKAKAKRHEDVEGSRSRWPRDRAT